MAQLCHDDEASSDQGSDASCLFLLTICSHEWTQGFYKRTITVLLFTQNMICHTFLKEVHSGDLYVTLHKAKKKSLMEIDTLGYFVVFRLLGQVVVYVKSLKGTKDSWREKFRGGGKHPHFLSYCFFFSFTPYSSPIYQGEENMLSWFIPKKYTGYASVLTWN